MKAILCVLFCALLACTAFGPVAAQEVPVTTTPDNVAGDIVDLTEAAAQATATSVENFLTRLVQTPKSDLARVLLVIGGLVLLLAGWRIYEVVILVAGFLMGAAVATSLVVADSVLINLALLLIGGLIGAALSVFLYYIAVFLMGAYVGIALTNGLAVTLALTPVSDIALLIGGLIGGIILIGLSFEFLIFISALVGAQILALGLGLGAVWVIILAVIGIVVQFALTRALHYELRRRPRRIDLFRRVTS
ncbi:MAG: hypothetical protein K8J31_29060 [Anaerolineae bacterium]|nr:hypothetical protein [Anaerolineae bacterium]